MSSICYTDNRQRWAKAEKRTEMCYVRVESYLRCASFLEIFCQFFQFRDVCYRHGPTLSLKTVSNAKHGTRKYSRTIATWYSVRVLNVCSHFKSPVNRTQRGGYLESRENAISGASRPGHPRLLFIKYNYPPPPPLSPPPEAAYTVQCQNVYCAP